MTKSIIIKEDTSIRCTTAYEYSQLFIDEEKYLSERSYVMEKLVAVLFEYQKQVQANQIPITVDLENCSRIIREMHNDFFVYEDGISNLYIVNRFSFLENDTHFLRKFFSGVFYCYQFQGKKSEFGEIQSILIGIPKNPKHRVEVDFRVIKNGKYDLLLEEEYPLWFRSLLERAETETDDMLKLRRLFLNKQPN